MAKRVSVKRYIGGDTDYLLEQGLVLAANSGEAIFKNGKIKLQSPDDKSISAMILGNKLAQKGDDLSGTITGMKFFIDGKLAMQFSGFSIPLEDMGDALDKIDRNDNWNAFEKILGQYAYTYVGAADGEIIYLGDKNDIIKGRGGDDLLDGDAGDDVLNGGGGDDALFGGKGDDKLLGGSGDDLLVGDRGKDVMDGGSGEDRVDYSEEGGGKGVTVNLAKNFAFDTFGNRDTLRKVEEIVGTKRVDKITGDSGDNYFVDTRGADKYDGRGGTFDQIAYHIDGGNKGVKVDLKKGFAIDTFGHRDSLKGIEVVRGSFNDDEIRGDSKVNVLRGLEGDDLLDGRGGKDQVRYDIDARYGGGDGVTVRLDKGWATDGFGDRDTLLRIENVRGSDSDDVIVGNGKANVIEGRGGDDVMTGKGGKDVFLFADRDNGEDVITDFQQGLDKIDLEIGVKRFGQLDIDYHDDGATVTWKTFDLEVEGNFDELTAADFLF